MNTQESIDAVFSEDSYVSEVQNAVKGYANPKAAQRMYEKYEDMYVSYLKENIGSFCQPISELANTIVSPLLNALKSAGNVSELDAKLNAVLEGLETAGTGRSAKRHGGPKDD